ncbi:hypothetical protein D1007_50635 [Hordeum vulgare]|uniref:uncharacterized protein LOC123430923 n=1 Tax=Hordeum vulgare subsp. vulgare TaxID=112509 RepID=UPI00162C6FCA|nr:uncharacterized protein LOC123430923 [Hordeum vulgare subsp. vulgare]KAE8776654.1 hypothetical protein D1007_50635 [Hordeum vulgare]
MDAAALADLDDLDFDLGSLDGFQCFNFEFDQPDYLPEFCGDGGCLLPAVSDKEGGLCLSLGSRDGDGGRESSPDSVVTDDGAPPRSSGDHDDGEMSAYVSDLKRFLLEDDDEAGGLFAAKDLPTNGHFFNDLVIPYVEPSTAPEEFATADHFFGDLDDGHAEPAAPGKDLVAEEYFFSDLAYIVPSTAGEDPVSDGYFYDVAVANDGCVEPAAKASVEDAASATEDEFAAAGEYDDEASSRKRARQRKDTAAVPREAELRATPRTRAMSSIGCRRLGHHRLPPCVTMCISA